MQCLPGQIGYIVISIFILYPIACAGDAADHSEKGKGILKCAERPVFNSHNLSAHFRLGFDVSQKPNGSGVT